MMQQTSRETFLHHAENANRVAVFREMPLLHLTPSQVITHLSSELVDGAILESGFHTLDAGQISIIAFETIAQFSAKNQQTITKIGSNEVVSSHHPLAILRDLLSSMQCAGQPKSHDFLSSAIGFLSYDAVRFFEDIPDRHLDTSNLPDILFNFYRTSLMIDHQRQTLLIHTVVDVGPDAVACYSAAQTQIDNILKKINQPLLSTTQPRTHCNIPHTNVALDINDERFIELIHQAKQYIVQGDAFQIVLSRCFKKNYSVTPLAIYQALREVSPSPYMFYLPYQDQTIVGASPEKMISVRNGEVTINPIAGTRKRSDTLHDKAIEQELLDDKKEHAEHMMLVDLARNDLGSVCKPGSIKIKELLAVKHFSHVSHITSEVIGQLQEGKDAFDALGAAFPAGTLSGAPKIRAMQIIDELETSRRGMYGGAVCRIDHLGNLDSCIAIRMAVLKDGTATVRTGAGIVYDSNPQSEANETRQKAQSVLDAIARAEDTPCC